MKYNLMTSNATQISHKILLIAPICEKRTPVCFSILQNNNVFTVVVDSVNIINVTNIDRPILHDINNEHALAVKYRALKRNRIFCLPRYL